MNESTSEHMSVTSAAFAFELTPQPVGALVGDRCSSALSPQVVVDKGFVLTGHEGGALLHDCRQKDCVPVMQFKDMTKYVSPSNQLECTQDEPKALLVLPDDAKAADYSNIAFFVVSGVPITTGDDNYRYLTEFFASFCSLAHRRCSLPTRFGMDAEGNVIVSNATSTSASVEVLYASRMENKNVQNCRMDPTGPFDYAPICKHTV